jgi:hypothetical protein
MIVDKKYADCRWALPKATMWRVFDNLPYERRVIEEKSAKIFLFIVANERPVKFATSKRPNNVDLIRFRVNRKSLEIFYESTPYK